MLKLEVKVYCEALGPSGTAETSRMCLNSPKSTLLSVQKTSNGRQAPPCVHIRHAYEGTPDDSYHVVPNHLLFARSLGDRSGVGAPPATVRSELAYRALRVLDSSPLAGSGALSKNFFSWQRGYAATWEQPPPRPLGCVPIDRAKRRNTMQTQQTITLLGTVSNSAISRISKNGRKYIAFGVAIISDRNLQAFHYNIVAFGKQGHFAKHLQTGTRIKLVVQAQSQPDNIATLPLLTATFVRPVRPVAR